MKKIIKTSNAPLPIGPYNQAILVGNMLFISGQIAINPETNKLVNTDIISETNQILNNIDAILDEAKFSRNDIVKVSIFVKDINNFSIINEEYRKFFTEYYPARELIEVSNLPANANIEISVIAVK